MRCREEKHKNTNKALTQARSSARLERPGAVAPRMADNREVPGSNPGGPTTLGESWFLFVISCVVLMVFTFKPTLT